MTDIIIAKDNTALVRKASEAAIARALEKIGGMAESYPKQELDNVVYSTPAGCYNPHNRILQILIPDQRR